MINKTLQASEYLLTLMENSRSQSQWSFRLLLSLFFLVLVVGVSIGGTSWRHLVFRHVFSLLLNLDNCQTEAYERLFPRLLEAATLLISINWSIGSIAVVLFDVELIVVSVLSLEVTDFEGAIEVGALDEFVVR